MIIFYFVLKSVKFHNPVIYVSFAAENKKNGHDRVLDFSSLISLIETNALNTALSTSSHRTFFDKERTGSDVIAA